jgi:hypothetical protein
MYCGEQLLSCGHWDKGNHVHTHPGPIFRLAEERGLYCIEYDSETKEWWKPCEATHPEAVLDLNKAVLIFINELTEAQRRALVA